jgi:pyrroloquinoline quinone biosynthesis protein B
MKILVLGPGREPPPPSHGDNPPAHGRPAVCAHAPPHAASSIAVSADGESWVLVNAAPDLGRHLRALAPLQPRAGDDGIPIRAVVLTDARIDHAAGLLDLRDGAGVELCATPSVFETLTTGQPLIQVLQQDCGVRWHLVPVAGAQTRARFGIAAAPTLRFTAIAVAGEGAADPRARREAIVGTDIALRIDDMATGASLFLAPEAAALRAPEAEDVRDADCVLVGAASSADDALLPALWAATARRRVLIHAPGPGPLHDAIGTLGIELARDGMEITL